MNSEQLKLCMRIAEYNLQANKFFTGSILYGDLEKQKQLIIEREKLITAVLNKFSKCKIVDVLRVAKFTNVDGTKTHNVTSRIEEIEAILNEGIRKFK